MYINKATYESIIQFGDLLLLKEKLRIENQEILDIVNNKNDRGVTLLQTSLANSNFEISKYFLDNGAKINVVTNQNLNELHFLSTNINNEGAIEIAKILINKNVDLNLIEKRLNNSAFWYICFEVFKKRNVEGLKLIETCLNKGANIDSKNIAGLSIRDLIEERGTNRLKKIIRGCI